MSPDISFVVFTRNDAYGQAGAARLRHSLDVLRAQLAAFRIDAEIIVVEWNPPADRPPLADALGVAAARAGIPVRVITVPSRFHARYRGHAEKGMHTAAAFNVGLRRARGRFVLPRPGDVFYTDDVLARLAERALDERTVYRVDRFDVSAAALEPTPTDRAELLRRCRSAVAHHRGRLDMPAYFDIRARHTNACGDFSLMSRTLWFEVRGWWEGDSVASLDVDSLAVHGAAALGAGEEVWADPCRVYKTLHEAITVLRVRQVWSPALRMLDAAVGRFFPGRGQNRVRMALDYPVRTMAGLSGTFPSFERNFLRRAQRWARGQAPFHLNAEDWGLAGEALPEISVG